MFDRLKTLVLLQLKQRTKRLDLGSKRIYANIAVQAVILVIVSIVMTLAVHVIKNIFYIPVNEYFAIFILVLTQSIAIIASVLGLTTDLYHSKDNQILFPLPVKNDEIFLSKMMVYYIQELRRNLFILIPILIALGYHQGSDVFYYINIIPLTFILPLISVSIATLLSIPMVLVKNFLKNHNIISAILSLIGFAILFYLIYLLVAQIPVPIRLVQLYNRFIIGLTQLMQTIAGYGTIYTMVGYLMYGIDSLLNYALIIVITAFLLLANYFIAKPLYLKLISSSQEYSVNKTKHVKIRESKSLFLTFFRKELIIARRSPNELITNYSLLFMLPIIMYVLNYIYMNMNRSLFGNDLVLILNVLIVTLVVTGSNTASASAITTEGYEFILLKTAPYDTSKIAWAKMLFNFLLTTLMIIVSFVLFAIALPVYPKEDIIYLFFFIILINFGHILWSLQLDILKPKLAEYATSGSLTDHDNIKKSLSIGVMLALIFTVVSIVCFVIAQDLGWVLMIGMALVFALNRFFSFRAHLKAYFIDIEY
ncbi:MAG TPA: hypothetical protein VIK67_00445 [Acholeplasma sp.]|jgi:hypothetical protein